MNRFSDLLQAVAAHYDAGRLSEAERECRRILDGEPEHAEALHWLGVLMLREERPEEAAVWLEKAVRSAPTVPAFHNNLGIALKKLGKLDEATQCYRQALALLPGFAEAHNNLGNALEGQGRLEEAAECYRRALASKPDFAYAHNNLGNVLQSLGSPSEAEQSFRRAIALDPAYHAAHFGLGNVLRHLGRFEEAEPCFRRALELAPRDARTLLGLSRTLRHLRRLDEALELCREAIALEPVVAESHFELGNILKDSRRLALAEESYRRALAIAPELPAVHNNLGIVLHMGARLADAKRHFEQALRLSPGFASAYNNLANVLMATGEAEAEQFFRKALALDPELSTAHSNLIFLLDFKQGLGVGELQAERRRWYDCHGRRHAQSIAPHANPPDPERRLRIGYVSADFRQHSASYAFAPVISRHDHRGFEIVCYSGAWRQDDVTARLRAASHAWRDVSTVSDAALAETIRADRIDILVDLSGHSMGNRLLVFARKPAPVQVSAWGLATGTGIATMDYMFADPVMIPAEARCFFAEEIVDLPCAICYEPPHYLPAAACAEPTDRSVTFGIVNRPEKISERVIALCAGILSLAPEARLLVKGRGLEDPGYRELLLERLARAGIRSERVRIAGRTAHGEHLEIHREIDVVLDTFPQGGGISTAEALAMGVPVVTLLGATPSSRIAASLLAAGGFGEWIARNEDEFVAIALRAAGQRPRTAAARESLSQRFLASAVGDLERYTRAAEQAYRSMWRRWCERQQPSNRTVSPMPIRAAS
jgi:predicted O-linked N-acetylglucosamine transferase (SPINDLY family)